METKEMIEKLRYKANNIKAKIEPEFFNEVADTLEKQIGKDTNVTSKNAEWISVRDKLPELNHFVFVTKRSEGDIFYGKLIVDIACYSKKDFKDEFYWRDWNLNEMKNEILAWMPMNFPKPYMEGKIDG